MQLLKKYLDSSQLKFLIILALFGLLLLLLFKNPFSTRNLISNLEPYPDTIHYLAPAINFTHGKGFYIEREGRAKNPNVPLLYSVYLMPLFIFSTDPRFFYFGNIFLSFISLFILYKIAQKLFQNIYISGLVIFFYVTNYFIYWYPNLAMAENLIIPLFLASIWVLISKVTPRKAILTGILVVAFYASKYATIPLSASLFILYLAKIIFENKNRLKYGSALFISTLIVFSSFAAFEYFSKGFNIFLSINSLFSLIFGGMITSTGATDAPAANSSPWFSTAYLPKNLNTYLEALMGTPMRFLWDNTPLVPKYVGIFGLAALIYGLFKKNYRFISIILITFLFSQIIFMSTFYSTDARYIYHAIPALLISFGLFLKYLKDALEVKIKKYGKVAFYVIAIIFFLFYLSASAIRIKSQISLNLRYTESPWYYISVSEANKYFDSLPASNQKPILISALPPYYVDFFSEGRYKLLPLSLSQEFQKEMPAVWGDQDFSDLIKLYNSYLERGENVYVSNYGLGNEEYLHRDFAKINENFNLEKVHEGCFNACNIYKLNLK